MRDTAGLEFRWVTICDGRVSLLLDRRDAIIGEVCRLPRELNGTAKARWSWLVTATQAAGEAPSEAEARRCGENAARAALGNCRAA